MKRASSRSKSGTSGKPAGHREVPEHRPSAASFTGARKWLFRLVAILLIPTLCIGGLEIALRLCGYGYETGLFKKIKIGDEQILVNNDDFGLRFFPRQLERFTGPIRMAEVKPTGTYRIFILGESAAMGDPEPAYGPARYLEANLSLRYPKTHFEIINLGITAINSNVILPIARDCARQNGDLWIVYMGNNEMVGPFGAATVFGAKAPPLGMIRLNIAMQKLRLGQLLVNCVRKLKGGSASMASWGGMEMFSGNRVGWNDASRKAVYENFSHNLDDIIQAGLKSGAKVLLSTVAVNLRDCSPFASLGDTNLSAADQQTFDRYLKAGVAAQSKGDSTSAAQNLQLALALDPHFAEVQYRLGQTVSSNNGANMAYYQAACDLDALSFRADSTINETIKKEKASHRDGQLKVFDAAALLAAAAPENVCGEETFYEHVHFNFNGAERLGKAWAEEISQILPPAITAAGLNQWPTRDEVEKRLGLSDWNRILVFNHMIGRLQQPPLNGQLAVNAWLEALRNEVNELQLHTNAANAAQTRASFHATIDQHPDDYIVRENFALFLQSIGELKESAQEWRHIRELLPHDFIAAFQLGQLLAKQGEFADAEINLRGAVALHPTMTQGWYELANVETSEKKFNQALGDYERARQQRPDDPETVVQMGKLLAQMNRHADAMQKYRAAIALKPDFWEAHYELAGELDAARQFSEAANEFGAAAQLNPGFSRAHFNFGVLLAKLGRMDEARHEFEETIRLEPGFKMAQNYLIQLQSMKNHAP